jgi:hypothetical protein
MFIERKGNLQLEVSKDFGAVYLQKVEPISECEYILKRYKVILLGDLPQPNMDEIMNIQIYNVEGNTLYYHVQIAGSEIKLEGKFVKISNEISKEFKEIIAAEK